MKILWQKEREKKERKGKQNKKEKEKKKKEKKKRKEKKRKKSYKSIMYISSSAAATSLYIHIYIYINSVDESWITFSYFRFNTYSEGNRTRESERGREKMRKGRRWKERTNKNNEN